MSTAFSEKKERRGNFSYANRHPVMYAIKEYPINLVDGNLIVGNHTPLELMVTKGVADFIANCSYFDQLKLQSFIEHDGQQYPATYFIIKNKISTNFATLQVVITTKQEFIYDFEEL